MVKVQVYRVVMHELNAMTRDQRASAITEKQLMMFLFLFISILNTLYHQTVTDHAKAPGCD